MTDINKISIKEETLETPKDVSLGIAVSQDNAYEITSTNHKTKKSKWERNICRIPVGILGNKLCKPTKLKSD